MPRWLKEIQIHLQELHERTSSPDDDIPLRLQEIPKSRFAYLEDINPVQLARFMDPRFHQLVGIPEAIVRGVEENICQTTQLLNPTAPPELILGHVNAMHTSMNEYMKHAMDKESDNVRPNLTEYSFSIYSYT